MMLRVLRPFSVFLALVFVAAGAHAQVISKAEAKPDYPMEAFVIEQSSTRITFENDGTGAREFQTGLSG
jgi:hypothetical protein